MKHTYILDTSVLLHDTQSILRFEENDLYIPLAVIDDLDNLKTRKDTTGFSAREVLRLLDRLGCTEKDKVTVNVAGGTLSIFNHEDKGRVNVTKLNSDDAIISAYKYLSTYISDLTIVSKDTGLRIRSKVWDCKVENYKYDLIENNENGIKGIRYDDDDLFPNEFAMIDDLLYRKKGGSLVLQEQKRNKEYFGIKAKNIEQQCAMELLLDPAVEMVCLTGNAGTGKSLMAITTALYQVMSGNYDKIIYIKPIIPVGGRDLGALPGDKYDKLYNWCAPLKDNLAQLDSSIDVERLIDDDKLELEAMTYIQGRSMVNSIIIVDEAENITKKEARMVIERCSKHSKVILLGDLSQIENPYLDKESCGLMHAAYGSRHLQNCGSITLTKVERSALSSMASEIFN